MVSVLVLVGVAARRQAAGTASWVHHAPGLGLPGLSTPDQPRWSAASRRQARWLPSSSRDGQLASELRELQQRASEMCNSGPAGFSWAGPVLRRVLALCRGKHARSADQSAAPGPCPAAPAMKLPKVPKVPKLRAGGKGGRAADTTSELDGDFYVEAGPPAATPAPRKSRGRLAALRAWFMRLWGDDSPSDTSLVPPACCLHIAVCWEYLCTGHDMTHKGPSMREQVHASSGPAGLLSSQYA